MEGSRADGSADIAVPVYSLEERKVEEYDNMFCVLITVQQDATYSVYYIFLGSSTCFGC